MENIHEQLLTSVRHIEELMTSVVAKQEACPLLCQTVSLSPDPSQALRADGLLIIDDEVIEPAKWMMLKTVWPYLGISRSALYEKIALGQFHRYCQKKDAHLRKPRVWLLREEVEAYRKDNPLK